MELTFNPPCKRYQRQKHTTPIVPGNPYPGGNPAHPPLVFCNLEERVATSVVVVRDEEHPLNLSGGKEVFVPERFLYGLIPHALLDAYHFWKDESRAPVGTPTGLMPLLSRGYKRLLG